MISVIIPNLHSPIIDQVVHSIDYQTSRSKIDEIIVVGQDRYKLVPKHVHFVDTPQPLCAAAARNLGAHFAQSDYLLFLDADCIATSDLVSQFLNRHRQGYAIVGGSVALGSENYWTRCDNIIVFFRALSETPAGTRRYLPSMNLSILSNLFFQIGGFDERIREVGEDIDLSLRLRKQGYTLFFEPQAVVYHYQQRISAAHVWTHLRSFGRAYPGLERNYPGMLTRRINFQLRTWSGGIIAIAPLLAVWDVINIYRTTPFLRHYWEMIPGMIWCKTAWYWGVVEGLLALEPGN